MRSALIKSLPLLALLLASPAGAGGLAPWKFGMSKTQVSSFGEYGPYRSFSNGDLETYNGLYQGHKENVQFFFEHEVLRRIGVYLYEGSEADAAAEAWKRVYVSLQAQYGELDTPGLPAPANGRLDPQQLAEAAIANTRRTGRTLIAPRQQPRDMSVSSSLMRGNVQGTPWYYVVVNFDPAGP
jgi:hypothetical protein